MNTGLRKIDIKGRVRRPQPDQDMPELTWVRIDKLLVNDAYQRLITRRGWTQIEKIAKNFDWGLFVPAVVSPMGNSFALIDGQHRAHAAYLAGFDEIPAICVEKTAVEQAAAFAAINTQVTRMSSLNVYKAAKAAKETWALEADQAVSDAGCRLMEYAKSAAEKKIGEIFSVTLIRKHILAGEGEVVTACLSAIRQNDDLGMRDYYNGPILKGFFEAVASNVQFLRKIDLIGFCTETDLLAVFDDAGARASAQRVPKGPIYRQNLIVALEAYRSLEGIAAQ